MQSLELFEYMGHEVRVQVGESGEPLFVLVDLAAALGIANVTQLRSRLSDDLCQTYPMSDRLGRVQQVWVVTEPGLYEVVIRSDKPEAVAFRRWVTGEVLPSIRRHGVYATEAAVDAMLADPETMIRTLTALQDERAARVRAEAVAAEAVAEVEAQRPHADLGRAVVASGEAVLPSVFGTVLSARVEGMGPNKFCRWLREAGYVYRRGGQMVPTARAIAQGLLEASEVQVPGGGVRVQTWVLPKGQERFVRELLAERGS
nr:MAG TPA: repressor domain protein [Caudoviricetes sp.]